MYYFLHGNNLILFTLNLPAGSGMRIPPTIFETWQVFVQVNTHLVQGGLHTDFSHVYIIVLYRHPQSTSYGRNLMGGTDFLYEV